jgi:hypothetical protein
MLFREVGIGFVNQSFRLFSTGLEPKSPVIFIQKERPNMATFLKIENPGVCPTEGFILLGATSKRLDESRNVDDYQCRNAAARAMAKADAGILARWMRSFRTGTAYWEHQFGG